MEKTGAAVTTSNPPGSAKPGSGGERSGKIGPEVHGNDLAARLLFSEAQECPRNPMPAFRLTGNRDPTEVEAVGIQRVVRPARALRVSRVEIARARRRAAKHPARRTRPVATRCRRLDRSH